MLYLASGLESFTGALGTAAFLAFLMAIVDKRRAAAEYALLSSLFAIGHALAGFGSRFGVEAMGYANYFLLTFFLAFPAYLLLPWVLRMLNRHSSSHEAVTSRSAGSGVVLAVSRRPSLHRSAACLMARRQACAAIN